jgi:gluconokinase
VINVGTSAALRLCTESPPETPPGLWWYRVDRRLSLVGGATSEGGNVFAWCVETLRLPGEDAIEDALGRAIDEDRGLGVLPFLAGERSPGWNGRARAAIAGLSLDTTPLDILHAALQSIAFRLGLIYARLRPLAEAGHEIVVSGGALARSRAWAQMVADVLGHPLTLARESELTSRGAALLALDALGVPPGRAGIRPPPGDRIVPRPEGSRRYEAALARHVRLYDALLTGPGAPGLAGD